MDAGEFYVAFEALVSCEIYRISARLTEGRLELWNDATFSANGESAQAKARYARRLKYKMGALSQKATDAS